jgi:hypothetical protein
MGLGGLRIGGGITRSQDRVSRWGGEVSGEEGGSVAETVRAEATASVPDLSDVLAERHEIARRTESKSSVDRPSEARAPAVGASEARAPAVGASGGNPVGLEIGASGSESCGKPLCAS